MSFDVFLLPSTASLHKPAYIQETVAALRSAGVRDASADGGTTPDGVPLETYGGDGDGVMFALRGLSPGVCKAIFQVAKRTQSYIYSTGGIYYVFKVEGTRGRLRENDMKVRTLATPEALCVVLRTGYGTWSGYADHVRKKLNPH